METLSGEDKGYTASVAIIILAAGLGTRMKSKRAKVLHEINGIPMICYVVETAKQIGANEIIIVIGHQAEKVQAALSNYEGLTFAHQDQQLGTGHAVMSALPLVSSDVDHVVVLCGDVPLLQPATVIELMDDHLSSQREVSILAIDLNNPTGYGRVLMGSNRRVEGIIEEADADADVKQIITVNAGIYCINRKFLKLALEQLNTDNAQNEFYLTDIVAIAHQQSRPVGALVGSDATEVSGVNTLSELAAVEQTLQARKR